MIIDNLPLREEDINLLKSKGYGRLYPPQEEAVNKGLLSEKNLIIAIPTASGKTLIGLLAILKTINEGKKALYLVPLRALGDEKYREFKELDLNVGISTGDYDHLDYTLKKYSVLILTIERCDSLLRNDTEFFNDFSLVIYDEIHLIDSPNRGPTLEVVISKLSDKRIIGLSATISNADEIASWLNATLVKSDWRPVPLKKGILLNEIISFENEEKNIGPVEDPLYQLCKDSINEGGQVLIFVNSRRSAESTAEKISRRFSITNKDGDFSDTTSGKKLEKLYKYGIGFHHAGLLSEDRKKVEEFFVINELKVIVATPTLAAGVNLPARRVIIKDYFRFDSNFGSVKIPRIEIVQMMGRAGRPKYDSTGEAILIAKREEEKKFLLKEYIESEPLPISSKLATEGGLRAHILSLIASGFVKNRETLHSFFNRTFYAFEEDSELIFPIIDNTLDFLIENSFLEKDFSPTPLGSVVSKLYIDPKSAIIMRDGILRDKFNDLGILHLLCSTPDMPTLYLRKKEFESYHDTLSEFWEKIIVDIPDYSYEEAEFEFFISQFKTALLFRDWINEEKEELIVLKYGIGEGDLQRLRENMDWLLYSLERIGHIFRRNVSQITKLRKRVKYGIREELMDLVEIKGIGRIRARRLYKEGITNRKMLNLDNLPSIRKAVGEKISEALIFGEDYEERGLKQTKIDEF
ncbi:MAG: DEAD/DEAH box helicase [Candidatus Methanofastidiosa archaeon]|nr:DEAD/DEAH box helicase [Candidatus Methanofastidiosa archaeon]